MAKYVLMTTTTPDRRNADDLAKKLVETGSAACVQVLGPVTSVYTWKGALETSGEWLLLIKSVEVNCGRIEALIRAGHPYEVPEIVAIPVTGGSYDYLAWIDGATQV